MKRTLGNIIGLLSPFTAIASFWIAVFLARHHQLPLWEQLNLALASGLLIVLGMLMWLLSMRLTGDSITPQRS